MIPADTLKIVGSRPPRFERDEYYALEGWVLDELHYLVERMSYSAIKGDELRDWQNRLSSILSDALKNKLATPKEEWIREACTDKFEGIPCRYPNCGCSDDNRRDFEEAYEKDMVYK